MPSALTRTLVVCSVPKCNSSISSMLKYRPNFPQFFSQSQILSYKKITDQYFLAIFFHPDQTFVSWLAPCYDTSLDQYTGLWYTKCISIQVTVFIRFLYISYNVYTVRYRYVPVSAPDHEQPKLLYYLAISVTAGSSKSFFIDESGKH